MILTTVQVDDLDRFLDTFTTKGAEKRREHGSGGAHIFRDPSDESRVWVAFEWDEEGFRSLISDPEMQAIFQEGGLKGPPQIAEFVQTHEV